MSDENLPPEGPPEVPAGPPADEPRPIPPVQPAYAEPIAPGPRRRHGAVWWGILLIFIGATLLIGQFVPGVELWRFWPLIVIALGVRQIFGSSARPWILHDAFDGLTTIAIGLVFLGQMLGYLSWNVWLNILQLWPLLLVAFGFEIIGRALRSELVRAIGSLVIIAGLAYGALVMSPGSGSPFWFTSSGESQSFNRIADHESSVTEGTAAIEGAVGELKVEGGPELVTAEGETPFEPVFEADAQGSSADVRVGLGSGSWWPGRGNTRLNVTLDEQVAWDLNVETGVSSYKVDLRDVIVKSLDFNAGVSEGVLTLGAPEGKPSEATIETGVSSFTLRVPRGYPVRVKVEAGLTNVEFNGEWSRQRDGDERVYESSGFSEDEPYWDIVTKGGIGSVRVEFY